MTKIEILDPDTIEAVLRLISERKAAPAFAITKILASDLGECVMTIYITDPFVEDGPEY